ncbi:MAG: D-alanine--D-alanine ligase [Balneolaceae bacterium]|nr:MAG: D-alanine--D-alanine ligase [Balneolaceae bacterium]
MKQKTILTAFGGSSPEHEVSVITAHQAMAALSENREYIVKPLYISKSGRWLTGDALLDLKNFENLKNLEKSCSPCHFSLNEFGLTVLSEETKGFFAKPIVTRIDTVLTAFHGSNGENGAFQGVCEMFNLPYTGSNVLSSALGMDKVIAKKLCGNEGIPVVDGFDFFEADWAKKPDAIFAKADVLNYPVIVKPVHLGSSIGVNVAKNREDLEQAIELAFRYDRHLLIEKVVSPLMEINCSVLGSDSRCKVSVCEKPLGKEELLSFQDKYLAEEGSKGMAAADREIPADIPAKLTNSIQDTAKQVFTLLGCSGLARLDFLVDAESNKFYFNEINTIPGSFSFYLWKESGIAFTLLLKKMIDIANEEHQKKSRQIQSYDTNLLSKKAVSGIKGLKANK